MISTRTVTIGALLVTWLSLAACTGQPKVSDADIQKIDYGQLVEMLERTGDDAPILVDVRSAEKFAAGHLPGAINIPFTELNKDHPALGAAEGSSLFPRIVRRGTRPIIVYSHSWTDALSHSASKKLMRLGYAKDRVYDFRGGLDFWQKSGGTVTTQ